MSLAYKDASFWWVERKYDLGDGYSVVLRKDSRNGEHFAIKRWSPDKADLEDCSRLPREQAAKLSRIIERGDDSWPVRP